MTRHLQDVLVEAARPPRWSAQPERLWERGRRRRQRKHIGAGTAALALVAVLGGLLLDPAGVELAPTPPAANPPAGTEAPARGDATITLPAEGAPLPYDVVASVPFGEGMPEPDGSGESPCCLALVDGVPVVVSHVNGRVHVLGDESFSLDLPQGLHVAQAVGVGGVLAVLDGASGDVLADVPEAGIAPTPVALGIERIANGREGLWGRDADGWRLLLPIGSVSGPAAEDDDPVAGGTLLPLPDGSHVGPLGGDAEVAVLVQEVDGQRWEHRIAVADRSATVVAVAAVGPAEDHAVVAVVEAVGPEGSVTHRLVGLRGDRAVDLGALSGGQSWAERIAIGADGTAWQIVVEDAVMIRRHAVDVSPLWTSGAPAPGAADDAATSATAPGADPCAGAPGAGDADGGMTPTATAQIDGPAQVGDLLVVDWQPEVNAGAGEFRSGFRAATPGPGERAVDRIQVVYGQGADWLRRGHYVVVTSIEGPTAELCRHVAALRDLGRQAGGGDPGEATVRGRPAAVTPESLTWMERPDLALQIIDVDSGLQQSVLEGLAEALVVRPAPGAGEGDGVAPRGFPRGG